MELMSGIGAVSAAIQGASSLVRELKRPKEEQQDFAKILQQDLARNRVTPAQVAEKRSADYMRTYDIDGNGMLSQAESGFRPNMFNRLDMDQSGGLNVSELRGAFLNHVDSLR